MTSEVFYWQAICPSRSLWLRLQDMHSFLRVDLVSQNPIPIASVGWRPSLLGWLPI